MVINLSPLSKKNYGYQSCFVTSRRNNCLEERSRCETVNIHARKLNAPSANSSRGLNETVNKFLFGFLTINIHPKKAYTSFYVQLQN